MQEMIAMVFTPERLSVVAGVWASIWWAQRAFPCLRERNLWLALLPVLPLVFCTLAALALEQGPVLERMLIGSVMGMAAAHGNKIFKQTIMGQGLNRSPAPRRRRIRSK